MKMFDQLFDGSNAHELGSATAENAVSPAEESNPQRVEAPQTVHRHDCESNVYFDCPGCAAAYMRQQIAESIKRQAGSDVVAVAIAESVAAFKLTNVQSDRRSATTDATKGEEA